jgi:molybdopterin biosynthesis enzyme
MSTGLSPTLIGLPGLPVAVLIGVTVFAMPFTT